MKEGKMFSTLGALVLSAVVIVGALVIYVFRGKMQTFLKSEKKEQAQEFRRQLELCERQLGNKWLPEWPGVLVVWELRQKLPDNQQDSPAALGNALKSAFDALSRKEADTIARFFMRSVYAEVKRDLARRNSALVGKNKK